MVALLGLPRARAPPNPRACADAAAACRAQANSSAVGQFEFPRARVRPRACADRLRRGSLVLWPRCQFGPTRGWQRRRDGVTAP